jgi:ligand-binding sensor domain-containing protein/signal transduction histidine kinase
MNCFQSQYLFQPLQGQTTLARSIITGLVSACVFVLCLGNLCADSQHTSRVHFRQISLEQGLSQSSVYAIVQDKQGFLWFGTQDGLNRFDGYTLTVFRQKNNDVHSLPNNCIQTLYEDRSGSLWIGTRGGGAATRNLFTGNFEKAYKPLQTSLGNEEHDVYAFAEDQSGKMWIGTGAGLLRVNPSTGAVEESFTPANSPLKSTMIRALVCDNAGVIWIATPKGLFSHNFRSKQWRAFQHIKGDDASLPDDNIQTMMRGNSAESGSNELWLATASALVRFNIVQGSVVFAAPHASHLRNATANALVPSGSGAILIGYGGDGLHELKISPLVQRGTAEVWKERVFHHEPNHANSLSNDVVLSLYRDNNGGLWVGTDGGGVNYSHPDEYRFESFMNDAVGTGGNLILALAEDTQSNIWLGTLSNGIARFHPTHHGFTTFTNISTSPSSLVSNFIWSLYTDRSGMLWIGTNSGLSKMNPASIGASSKETFTKGTFTNYVNDGKNSASLPDDAVYSVLEDSRGNFWVATDGGLALMNRTTGAFTSFRSDGTPSSLSSNMLRKIYEDRSGILWIGTRGGGLNRFDARSAADEAEGTSPQSASFLHFRHNPNNPTSLSNDYVLSIHEDRSGTLWVGTAGGLNRFDRTNGTFTTFSESEGLPNNYVCGILEDDSGNLWLATVKGLCKFDPRTGKFSTFEELYSRAGSEFNQDACLKARNGMLYFGGINGFVRFHPDSIHTNFAVPPIVLTGFKKFNKPVDMRLLGDSLMSVKRELHLSVDDTFISFEFAALSYTLPHKIVYSCKLEGFDKDWIDLGNRREATYTNLDAGEYIFCIRATNYDGVWNQEGRRVRVVIHPHWWQTWWAKCAGAGIFALLLFGGYKWRIRQIELRNDALETTIAERTAAMSLGNKEISRQNETLMLLNQEKNEFLGIAAHDLKNPLTAIMMSSSIVKQYHSKMTADEVIEQMEHILITAKRMKDTILNLLDINSIESGRFKFSPIAMNMVEVVNDVVEGYFLRAKDKEILLHFNTETDEIMTFADRNAIMQILENLISNSIKYSPLGKNVYVNIMSSVTGQMPSLFAREESAMARVPMEQNHVRIEFQDEGPGLSEDDQKKLFGKFAKLSAKPTGGEHSTGLGLSIVKKVVEAMHGRVWCESVMDNGATFIVELPIVEIPPEAMMQD